jgi:hypothetical protein
MSAERFTLFPCSFVHGGGTLNLAQMEGFDAQPTANVKRVYAAGAVDPKAHLVTTADPRVTFRTRDLTTLFTTVSPLTGLASSGAGATFRLQEREEGTGIFLSTATHETFTLAKNHLTIDSISAAQDDRDGAVCECTCHALYDLTNLPIVHNTAVDFTAAPAPAFTSEFFMGPVYHNSVQLPGVIRHGVEFGTVFTPFRQDGAVFPAKGFIARRQPVIKVTTQKMDEVASISKFLRALSGVFAVYFWKAVDNGVRVAVASGVHLKISCAAGAWNDDNLTATENEDGTATLSIMPTGSLSYSITSAIP